MTRAAPGLVLLYHRIGGGASDPLGLGVEPELFAGHVARLRDTALVVPLADVGGRSEPTIAVTFDDGYADNFEVAGPILEAAGVPATLFVAGDVLDHPGEFWWDQLEHLTLEGDIEGPSIDVVVGGRRVRIDVRTRAGRERALKALSRRLRVLPRPELLAALAGVAEQTGGAPASCERHRRATTDHVRAAGRSGTLGIGSHTVSHTMLSAQSEEAQRAELEESRAALGAVVGRPVEDLAYPYGTVDSYTDTTVRLAGAAGYRRAFTNLPGVVRRRSDRFRLPRMMVHAWSPDELTMRIRDALGQP